MGVYRTLLYKMHYKWPVYRWRYTGRIPYTMKKFQNIRGRIYLQRYTRIPLKICFSLSFVSSTTCSSTAARAGGYSRYTLHSTASRSSFLRFTIGVCTHKASNEEKSKKQKQPKTDFRPFSTISEPFWRSPPTWGLDKTRHFSTFLVVSRRFSTFLDTSSPLEKCRAPTWGGASSIEEKSTKLPKNRFYTNFALLELFNRA